MSENAPNYISGRHKFARGPVTNDVKTKLVSMILNSEGKEGLLAEDIIEAIAVGRNDNDGFKAVSILLDQFLSDYTVSEK